MKGRLSRKKGLKDEVFYSRSGNSPEGLLTFNKAVNPVKDIFIKSRANAVLAKFFGKPLLDEYYK